MTGYLIVKNSSIGWIVSLDDDDDNDDDNNDDDDGYNDDEYNDEYNDDDDDCLWRCILSEIDSRRLCLLYTSDAADE